jgi:tyrosyl-tRNA synthetase
MKSVDERIEHVLARGVSGLIDPGSAFKEKLQKKAAGTYSKDIIVKFGADPTRPDIHLGHAVVLRTLRTLQDLGCKVVFVVGDFTSLIGDPTGKNKTRPMLLQKEIEENMATYIEQIKKILRTDTEVFSWIRNSDWYVDITDLDVPQSIKLTDEHTGNTLEFPANSFPAKAVVYEQTRMQKNIGERKVYNVTMQTLLNTLRRVTYAQLIERDMFQERLREGGELYMHEMVYPVLQGIDSHVLANVYGSCDLEIGGSDQTFNMLMGRTVQKNNNQQEQAVMSLELLVGTDGKEKMSKSLDNYIGINEPAEAMYGKIMSIPDTLIEHYFTLCTYTPIENIKELIEGIANGKVHPRDAKMRLAKEIVAIYHGEQESIRAEQSFTNTFQKGEVPEQIQEARFKKGTALIDALIEAGTAESKSELRRLASEGGIKIHHEDDWKPVENILAPLEAPGTFKIGKKRFLKIVVE